MVHEMRQPPLTLRPQSQDMWAVSPDPDVPDVPDGANVPDGRHAASQVVASGGLTALCSMFRTCHRGMLTCPALYLST